MKDRDAMGLDAAGCSKEGEKGGKRENPQTSDKP